MSEAEKISKEYFDARKILVISAIGTREYYKKLDLHNLTPTKKDQLDAGFRPLTFTGLYAAP